MKIKPKKKPSLEAFILLALALLGAAKARADQPVHMSCISRDTKTQLVADFVVMGDGLARGSIQRLNGGQHMSLNNQTASISYSLKGNKQTKLHFRPLSVYSGVKTATLVLPGNLEAGTVTTGMARLIVKGPHKSSVAAVNCHLAQI
jgi:hypothetical protein